MVQLQISSYYYKAIPDPEELALRHRLRELAGVRVRFGYRRLTIMLRREGWLVNAKRVFRLVAGTEKEVCEGAGLRCAWALREAGASESALGDGLHGGPD